ncbi:MAG: hypothetical protein ACYCU7_03690 [Acidimicrobiales bacterium]
MPTREQVLALHQTSRDYGEVGRVLRIWPERRDAAPGELEEPGETDVTTVLTRARRHAPTRPHPHAPKSPAVAVKAAGTAAAMDKMRDAVGERPAERRGRATQDIERSEEAG